MNDNVYERVVEVTNFLIDNKATVRATAKKYNMSKSCIHDDVTNKISKICSSLASQAREILDANKADRHNRGGEVTRQKFLIK